MGEMGEFFFFGVWNGVVFISLKDFLIGVWEFGLFGRKEILLRKGGKKRRGKGKEKNRKKRKIKR